MTVTYIFEKNDLFSMARYVMRHSEDLLVRATTARVLFPLIVATIAYAMPFTETEGGLVTQVTHAPVWLHIAVIACALVLFFALPFAFRWIMVFAANRNPMHEDIEGETTLEVTESGYTLCVSGRAVTPVPLKKLGNERAAFLAELRRVVPKEILNKKFRMP